VLHRTIAFTDGSEYPVSTPSIFVARLVHRADSSLGIMTPAETEQGINTDPQGFFCVLIAALLTAAEPWQNGAPGRTWTADEVASNLGPAEYGEASNAAVDLLYDFWGITRPSDEEAAKILKERADADKGAEGVADPNQQTPSRKRRQSRA
jgi:hypothetical protein